MSWIFVAFISHFLFAVVFAIDKILVGRYISPIQYALIIGFFEGLAVLLIPFVNFLFPNFYVFLLSLLAGASFIFGLYFYFKALEHREATWITPMVFGIFMPIASFGLNYFILGERLSVFQIAAFIFLVSGGVILSLPGKSDKSVLQKSIFPIFIFMIIASLFLSSEFTLLKLIFQKTNFISGYIISRFSGFLLALAASLFIFNKEKIIALFFSDKKQFGKILIFKQILSGLGNFLLFYAVWLASPTLVNATGGFRFIFFLIIIIFLSYKFPKILEEKLGFKNIFKKIIAVLLVGAGLIFLFFQPFIPPGAKIWGLTYSSFYARQFGFDEIKLLKKIIDDLGVKEFRLIAYWPEIEPKKDSYDFFLLDSEIKEIEKTVGKIILTLGMRVPRWPECHIPKWIENESKNYKEERILRYISQVVARYKNNAAVWAWQVENEPFLGHFGECPKTDPLFLDKEIRLVKLMDNTRPIIISDSGELGRWHKAYQRSDIFGTTMYRVIWNKYTGYFTYPLNPSFFQNKAGILRFFFGPKEIINVELQAEPWLQKRPWETPLVEQIKAFPFSQFKENIEYAKNVGFEKNYLWGAEWWYWMKEKNNIPEFWEEAKKLF
ncbi:MAG: cellulase family glycosylhydrolase [Parcubacteria group bacterium]|nr:cellulase family glycosylhydrolase [Parcubacteria group bacterium]